jgi:hypothetical protein
MLVWGMGAGAQLPGGGAVMTIAGIINALLRLCRTTMTRSRVPDNVPDTEKNVPDMSRTSPISIDPIDPEIAITIYERERKRRWRAARNGVPDMSGTCPGQPHKENLEKYKKEERHPISEKWEPEADGRQLGIQAFGADGVDAAIAIHRDTWLSRPERLTDVQWQAKWRGWCRVHIAPPLPLPPQLAIRRGQRHAHREADGRRSSGAPPELPSEPDDPLWTPVRQRLVADTSIGELNVRSWFGGARLELCNGGAMLLLASKHTCQYVESHFEGQIIRAIKAVHPGTVRVVFAVKPADQQKGVSNG